MSFCFPSWLLVIFAFPYRNRLDVVCVELKSTTRLWALRDDLCMESSKTPTSRIFERMYFPKHWSKKKHYIKHEFAWILQCVSLLNETQILKDSLCSDGIQRTTQLKCLPALWVRVLVLYISINHYLNHSDAPSYSSLSSNMLRHAGIFF